MIKGDVKVLYKNHQWMVQDEPKGWFIVQVNERDPEDTESGYWFRAKDLEADLHFPILHVCEKTWVDIDALEQAVVYAVDAFGLKPRYSVADRFARARKDREIEDSAGHRVVTPSNSIGSVEIDATRPTCRGCKWWAQLHSDGKTIDRGECRADAPTCGPNGMGVWPLTVGQYGCGEFEPRPVHWNKTGRAVEEVIPKAKTL